MARKDNGLIRPGYDPFQVPDAPTIGTPSAGNESATVAFTAPSNVGGSAITSYGAAAISSTNTTVTGTGASSPITVSGLTNGTAYTFKVWAINAYGPGPQSAVSNSVTPANERGLFAGGSTAAGDYSNSISYISINSLGNSANFGDLTTTQSQGGGFASTTRAVFSGGTGTGGTRTNVMNYVTIDTTGNATDFGDLISATGEIGNGAGSSTRGILFGGYVSGFINVIQYATIASAGNATDFGDLNEAKSNAAACSSPTVGVFAGGYNGNPSSPFSHIGQITIASTGNSTTFGSLVTAAFTFTGCSNNTRGIFAGSGSSGNVLNVIQYITIASAGNSIDFGDLSALRGNLASVSSPTRAVFTYGQVSSTVNNTLDYITIASTGNTVTFGDLNNTRKAHLSASNCHGGI